MLQRLPLHRVKVGCITWLAVVTLVVLVWLVHAFFQRFHVLFHIIFHAVHFVLHLLFLQLQHPDLVCGFGIAVVLVGVVGLASLESRHLKHFNLFLDFSLVFVLVGESGLQLFDLSFLVLHQKQLLGAELGGEGAKRSRPCLKLGLQVVNVAVTVVDTHRGSILVVKRSLRVGRYKCLHPDLVVIHFISIWIPQQITSRCSPWPQFHLVFECLFSQCSTSVQSRHMVSPTQCEESLFVSLITWHHSFILDSKHQRDQRMADKVLKSEGAA